MQKAQPWKALKRRGLYLPAFTIVMVAVTLTVMHTISTIRTLNRERRHWINLFERNGRDMVAMVRAELRPEETWSPKGLKELVDRMVENLDIAYIGLLEKNGQWITGSRLAQRPEFPIQAEKSPHDREVEQVYQRIKKLPDGKSIFEFGEFVPQGDIQATIVGLWMTHLEEARSQDIRHAVVMGVILLVLGSAAFYFIFVVQNYYLVDRTLAEMKSYTENVVESMANGLITVDREGQIVSTNHRASDILGLDTKRIRGRSLESVIPLQGFDLDDVLHQERHIIEKETECSRGQDILPLSVSATPLRDPDGVNMGAVIVLRDMREIRELQEQVRRSERLASLGRLASGVAHEIRNPLSSIKGFAQYFGDKFQEGTEDRSYAAIMIEEVERLNRVITQLLDFARPKELRLHLHPLSQILDHPLRLIQADLDRTGIKLKKSPFPKDKIRVDSDQITQALLNIFLNATESMGSGGELYVETIQKPEQKWVEIRISDAGSGISQENLPRIFDPFFSTKKKGTGLGLAITAKIIEAHKGEISVESEEGKGTIFRIHLTLPRN
jgi:two-component system sensor histidine kinase HydH